MQWQLVHDRHFAIHGHLGVFDHLLTQAFDLHQSPIEGEFSQNEFPEVTEDASINFLFTKGSKQHVGLFYTSNIVSQMIQVNKQYYYILNQMEGLILPWNQTKAWSFAIKLIKGRCLKWVYTDSSRCLLSVVEKQKFLYFEEVNKNALEYLLKDYLYYRCLMLFLRYLSFNSC